MYFAIKNLKKKDKKTSQQSSQPAKCKVGMIIFEVKIEQDRCR